jgi:hypothetical protein
MILSEVERQLGNDRVIAVVKKEGGAMNQSTNRAVRRFFPSILCASLLMLFVYSLAIICYGQQQKPAWKARIETEDGHKIIVNPDEPKYGNLKLNIKEDLSIGNPKDSNYSFNIIWDLQVDDAGNIYVTDNGTKKVRKFGIQGEYLNTFTVTDHQPEEINPKQTILDEASGKIYILNFKGLINVFDANGRYLDDIRSKNKIIDISLIKGDSIWGILEEITGESVSHCFCLINSKGEIIKEFARFPYDLSFVTMLGQKGIVSGSYLFRLYLANVAPGSFLYGYSGKYHLNLTDEDGNLLYRIRRNVPVKKYPEKELRRKRADGIKYPDYEPLFSSIFSDSEGRIYVMREESNWSEYKAEIYDVFGKNGYFLYETALPYRTFAIKNGYLYSAHGRSGDGAGLVKRYRILNWESINKD